MKITSVRVRQVTGTMATDGPFWEDRLFDPSTSTRNLSGDAAPAV